MFNELEFRIECLQDHIKALKKEYKSMLTVLLISISLVIFDFYMYFTTHSISSMTLICLGVIITNIIWMMTLLFDTEYQRKSESRALEHYKTLQETNIYVQTIEKLKRTEMQYHELKAEMEKTLTAAYHENKQPKSESPTVEK